MDPSTRRQRLGTAQLAVGLWMLVAALVACVTWPGPKDLARVDLARASLPVVGLIGVYLSVTAMIHLAIGTRLRQEQRLRSGGILVLFADHLAVLGMVVKVSLSNPASPVYLAGSETLVGVLATSILLSLTTGLLCWFIVPEAFTESEHDFESAPAKPTGWTVRVLLGAVWVHIPITLGLLYALWRLDLQPLSLVK
jgi:hypothetical protein